MKCTKCGNDIVRIISWKGCPKCTKRRLDEEFSKSEYQLTKTESKIIKIIKERVIPKLEGEKNNNEASRVNKPV